MIQPITHSEPNSHVLSSSSAEAIMVQAEILMAKDFDEQIQHLGDRLNFLGDIRRRYLQHIGEITTFMAKNSNTSRKDGKHYIEASFAEMSRLSANIVSYDPNHPEMKLEAQGLMLDENGDKQTAVQNENSRSSFDDWQAFFAEGASLGDSEKAKEHADRISDDNGDLPFYFGHANNTFENGKPKIAVFTDGLEKFLEVMRHKLSTVQERAEKISIDLNRLVEQRKSALEGAHKMLNTFDQVKGQALSRPMF